MRKLISKKYNYLVIVCCFFCSVTSGQILADANQIANAHYVTQEILDSSNARRAIREPVTVEPLTFLEPWVITGPRGLGEQGAHVYSTYSFYLSRTLSLGYWWYISTDSLVNYYDDLITIKFTDTRLDPPLKIMIFDGNDYLLAEYTVTIDPTTNLSPGTIRNGTQFVLWGQSASNMNATSARGGGCDGTHNYVYQWQHSFDSTRYVNIAGATTDTVDIRKSLDTLYASNYKAVSFRRRVICYPDTSYTGAVSILLIDSLSAGVISPSTQTVAINQTPATIHGTLPSGGLCGGVYEYRWQFSNDNNTWLTLPGQTTDSLHFNTNLSNSAYYRLVVSCGTDIVYTNSVIINVSGSSLALKPGINLSSPIVAVAARKVPLNYSVTPVKYNRVYAPMIPIQDASAVNMSAAVEEVNVATVYFDSYGRTLQTITKQTSPLKKDNVIPVIYDQFGRTPVSYLPYTSDSTNGAFHSNPIREDSAFYKTMFPFEKINYTETIFDGSPFNIPLKQFAQGNSWKGSERGKTMLYRANNSIDSVRLWSIEINSENDTAYTNGYYLPGTLGVTQITDEDNMSVVKYTDEIGRTVMTKTLLQSSLVAANEQWLHTYYVYDEMNHLRLVIPPKAVNALKPAGVNWNLTVDSISINLCYAYYYDDLGRPIMKRIPGKGKSYMAYDIMNRVVMSQDANLRLTNQWTFVLYDLQSRPFKSGVITTTLSKDSIIAQAARSKAYPILSGTYTVTSENYYDDYSWIAATNAPLADSMDRANINNANFNTAYNSSPDYPLELKKSLKIKGAITGSKRLILNSTDYLYTVNFYDRDGRAIQTQQTNYSAGTDVSTVQYSYSGKILRSFLKHEKAGANAQTHTVLTKYSYDHIGRVTTIVKNFDSLGDKQISKLKYNELGLVRQKLLGDSIETQNYTYNIRGWILGINGDFVKTGGSTSNFFGELLSYDSGYTNSYYNGNIAGIRWKAGGDGIQRSYGYAYDNANRLAYADFYQQNSGSTDWTKDKVDFTVSNLDYDANGNILSMKQRGLLIGSSSTIDSLTYQYFTNSNLLKTVSDAMPANGSLGDFTDTTSTGDDYSYDVNGNTIRDNNRKMHAGSGVAGAKFNLLDKPDSMLIAGKSKTNYIYDASGVTLRKTILDSSGTAPVQKNYVNISGFVYLNDTLQFTLTEEGRIRYAKKRNLSTGDTYYTYEYDYFIKDHQANVRAVVTEEKDTAFYQATMEPARQGTEDALFANIYTPTNTVYNKPSAFDSDTANHKVSRLNGSTSSGNTKVGPSLVLKVMTGDKVQINTYAFYNTTTQQPQNGVNLLTDILSILPGAIIGNAGGKLVSGNSTGLATVLNPNVTQFLNNNSSYNNTKPKAFLNWILFDEQFNFVASNSGVQQVQPGSEKQALVAPLQTISKNGFLYIYVSNESPQDVYFDDLTVTHYNGPLIQEQSFYPFGLEMAGISSKAALRSLSAYKYNAGSELEDEGGLNYYNTFYRKYDAQIGRFTGIDIKAESFAGLTPFQFGNNNPAMFNDPMGDKFVQIKESAWSAPRQVDPRENLIGSNWFESLPSSWDIEAQAGGGGGGGGLSWGQEGVTFSGIFALEIFDQIKTAFNSTNSVFTCEFYDNGDFATTFSVNDQFDVRDQNGVLIGIVTSEPVTYFKGEAADGWAHGVYARMGYTSLTDKHKNLNWRQFYQTNSEKNNPTPNSWSPDPPDQLYYYTYKDFRDTDYNIAKNRGNYSLYYADSPNRYMSEQNIYFNVRVELVNVSSTNPFFYTLLSTFTYGFTVSNGILDPIKVNQISNPPRN